jgi:hypothetical protein
MVNPAASAHPAPIASAWLSSFAQGFERKSVPHVLSTILPDGFIRDALFLTWDTRSLGGHDKIRAYLDENLPSAPSVSNFRLDQRPDLQPAILDMTGEIPGALELCFTFESDVALLRGLARLVPEETSGEWKALSVFLILDALKDHTEVGPELGMYEGHTVSWEVVRAQRQAAIEREPYVLIGG